MPVPATIGKRGPGRPPGKLNAATKIANRERVEYQRLGSLAAKKILHNQLKAAYGTHHLLELFRDKKNPEIILERHIVRDMKRQETLLVEFEYGRDYVIVEGTPADWRAGDAVLNRAWGKPTEEIKHTGDITFSLARLAASRVVEPETIEEPEHVTDVEILE